MRKLIIAVSSALVLGTNIPCVSAEESTTAPAVSPENAEAVRQEFTELGRMFGVEAPEPTKAPKPKSSESAPETKSVADVMDKAVDKIAGVVGTMSKALEDIAPDVWRIMLKQQYVKAVTYLVFPLGWVITTLLYMFFVGKFWKPDPENTDQLGGDGPTEWELRMAVVRVIPTVITCAAGLHFFYRLSYSVALLINPEFYAIQDLLRMILNKGM